MKSQSLAVLRQAAIEHYSEMSINDRLAMAEFTPNRMYPTLSAKLGNLYYGTVRIWITPDGTMYANKPNISKAGK